MLYRCFIFILCISLTNVHAEIVLDNSFGPRTPLDGPDYVIGAELGQQHGGNLFHSFDRFSINSGERATFSGPNSVNNIISRVTGGYESQIDGILRTTIPQADFYLINPAGIMFGPNAWLDVQGSFHISTADTIRFQDGNQFNASQPENSLLTIAPLEAFGFLSSSPASLSINGSQLNVPTGETLSVVGGNLQLTRIFNEFGRINIASVAGEGDVTLKQDDLVLSAQPSNLVIDSSFLSISGEKDAGDIYIRAGQFELHNSMVTTESFNNHEKNIDIHANEFMIHNSKLSTISRGIFGQAGKIIIKVLDKVKLSGEISCIGGGCLVPKSSGNNEYLINSGSIYLEAAQLELADGAQISTSTNSPKLSGDIHIKITEEVILSGENNQGDPTGIFASSYHTGNAGNLQLEAGQLILEDGAAISAETWQSGQGGNITILVKGPINLSGTNVEKTKASVITTTTRGKGNGGKIEIKASQLHLTDGGQIRAAVTGNGKGHGGSIDIKAKNITVSDKGIEGWGESGIFASAMEKTTGNAGDIYLDVEKLDIQNNAKVGSSTFGFGQGGMLNIKANRISLTDGGAILARSLKEAQGNAGSIALATDTALLAHGSIIATEATHAGGGNINLQIRDRLYLIDNSAITTEAQGIKPHHSGGNIIIKGPKIFTLDNSNLVTKANKGHGGNITLEDVGRIIPLGNSKMDVSSTFSLNGKLQVNGLELNDNLVVFPPSEFKEELFFDNRCTLTGKDLSFIVTSRERPSLNPIDLRIHDYIPED